MSPTPSRLKSALWPFGKPKEAFPSSSTPALTTPPPSSDFLGLLDAVPKPELSASPPRILIIGAGSRGNAYAQATSHSSNGVVAAVAEPIAYKRQKLGKAHIWGEDGPIEGQEFNGWKEFVKWELQRRTRQRDGEEVPEGIDAVLICVLDEQHKEVILGLEPLGLHIMCEKPLATSLDDCVAIYKSLLPNYPDKKTARIFSIGHVLRYSPHNMLLRKLLLEDRVIGDIMSINHTEPVGWWHFTHSYVRGNWRKESTTAPSLLTKSCHDIDLLLWLLCSPPPHSLNTPAHIPTTITSTGSLQYFTKVRKPTAAGVATNCFSCPIEESCKYSAKRIYLSSQLKGLRKGNTHWPVDIVLPEIEECISQRGFEAGEAALAAKLEENYTDVTPAEEVSSRNWFGRCVYEADNDVCDDQVVTMKWENDPHPAENNDNELALRGRGAKTAVFHMVAHTKKVCERYTHIYGVDGEIHADSATITVEDFNTGEKKVYKPHMAGGHHGGGDYGLARQFILAVDKVKNHGVSVEEAQSEYVGCSLEEVIRSHAMVFAAEEARLKKKVVNFQGWWETEVEAQLGGLEELIKEVYE